MVGLVLALIVLGIVLSLFGLLWVGIPVAVAAVILFVLVVMGRGRRTAADKP